MSPIQQMLLGAGASTKATYVDDIFSIDVYLGNATNNRSIVNNIDLATEGGLVFLKKRGNSAGWISCDTVTGANKQLEPNTTAAQTNLTGTESNYLTAFNTNGFVIGDASKVNEHSGMEHAAWTWRKAPGFFDVVTYSNAGAGNTKTVNHSLGCSPGLIIIKSTDTAGEPWTIYHKDLGVGASSTLNFSTDAAYGPANRHFTAVPNSTSFTLTANNTATNAGGTAGDKDYVAYLFAGGESTAATARSVDFDGTGDYLEIPNSSDFSFGSGDFTVEGWFNLDSTSSSQTIIGVWDYENSQRSWNIEANNSGGLAFLASPNGSSSTDTVGSNCVYPGQWTHFAAVRNGNTLRLFVNGTQVATNSFTGSLYDNTNDKCYIGILNGAANITNGKISNIRVVKGTAVYTSSFKPPTAPLTNITNTKLLCCNNSSTTGSTVTPGTITANGDPTASTDSPFDDPAGFVFGEEKDESVIKCGSYVGNGSSTGPEINLGWEPQWIMVKNVSSSSNWLMFDSIRGLFVGINDVYLSANASDSESTITGAAYIDPTSTGFKIKSTSGWINTDGDNYVYICIRRPDGYVGKPVELGTGVFAMDYGNASSTSSIATYDSGFPVDFSIRRQPATSQSWYAGLRLTGTKSVTTDTSDAEVSDSNLTWDRNDGVGKWSGDLSSYLMWQWKRHAGFDVVAYKGDGVAGRQISHSLNKTVEMIWVKDRSSSNGWAVGHKGLNGGTNPWEYNLKLNEDAAEESYTNRWNDTAPTSTHFSIGTSNRVNTDGDEYIAMLFSSVDGISKVGYYTGDGVTNRIVSVGFNPRFLMVKRADSTGDWYVLDTTRGFDKNLFINTSAAQTGGQQAANTSASGGGFVMGSGSSLNVDTQEFIYYAHA